MDLAAQQLDKPDEQQFSTTEADAAGSYQYSSDTSMPSQDGALQWSIGGVPLQQQLRSSNASVK